MIVAGEVGKLILVAAGLDLSTAEEILLTINHPTTDAVIEKKLTGLDLEVGQSERDAEIEREDGALIPQTLQALQYVQFETEEDDFPDSGFYRLKLQANFPGGKIFRSETQFQRVLD